MARGGISFKIGPIGSLLRKTRTGIYRKQKFNAVSSKVDGIHFSSKLEAQVYSTLKMLQRCGAIKDLKIHPSFRLTRHVSWKPDFQYFCNQRKITVVVESKGVETADYKIKKNLWKELGPYVLEVWKGNWRKPFLAETITPLSLEKHFPVTT